MTGKSGQEGQGVTEESAKAESDYVYRNDGASFEALKPGRHGIA